MRHTHLLLLCGLLPAALACASDSDVDEEETPRVAVWSADSARIAPADPSDPAESTAVGDAGATGNATPTDTSAGTVEAPPPATPGIPGAGGSNPAAEAPPAAATEPGAEAVLQRAEQAYEAVRTMRADFVQDLTVPLLDSTQRSRGEIFHRKPDRFLMRFSDPEGDRVVADGQHLWLYYPSTDPHQVIRTSAGEAGRLDLQREFLSNPTDRFDSQIVGRGEVGGRPATEIRLVPRGSEPYRQVRLWIDDADSLARRFEIIEANDNVRRVELSNLRVNVELSDDLFHFQPPADAQVFDQ